MKPPKLGAILSHSDHVQNSTRSPVTYNSWSGKNCLKEQNLSRSTGGKILCYVVASEIVLFRSAVHVVHIFSFKREVRAIVYAKMDTK